jgi:PAS domain S-box-containing protein
MCMKYQIISKILILLFIVSVSSYSQELNVNRYTTRNGLPTNHIINGIQKPSGQILLASDLGVISYNGKDFDLMPDSVFQHYPTSTLKYDKHGKLWVMPENALRPLQIIENNSSLQLSPIIDSEESGFGLKSINFIYENNKSIPVVLSKRSEIFIYKNDSWKELFQFESDFTINNMTIINDTIYLATTNGLYTYHDSMLKELSDINMSLPTSNTINLIEDPTDPDMLWLLSNKWLGFIKNETFELLTDDFSLITLSDSYNNSIFSIVEENVFFGNEFSLYLLNKNNRSVENVIFDEVSQGEGGISIFLDYESNIWITTYRGLYKIRFTPFKNISAKDGLLYDEVTAIEFLSNNSVALGQEGNLAIYNKSTGNVKNIPIDSGEEELNIFLRIWDLLYDSMERLWVVEYARGVGILEGQRINWLELDLDYKIETIAENYNGDILLGTENGLYKLLANSKVELYDATKGISIRKIFKGSNKKLYLATKRNGLWVFENSKFELIVSGYRNIDNVYAVLESSKYGTLLGTKAGLYVLEENLLNKFNVNNFSISKATYLIREDSQQNLWFGLSEGLIKWNGINTINYTTNDGLSGLELNRDTGYMDEQGNLWFGTNGGLSIFNSTYDYNPNVKPKGNINFIESFKSKYLGSENISFASNENNLVFDVSAYSFLQEDDNKFHIALLDDDKQIVDSFLTDNSRIRFSYLSPGDYTFNLQVENAKGTLSDSIYTAAFSISSPFYKTIWFMALSGISLIIITSIIFQYFSQVRYSKNLENVVALRTRDLRNEISKKEHYEKALIESEKRYKGLFENSAFGIYQSTIDGKFVLCNSSFLKMFGLKSMEELNQFNIANTFYINSNERKEFVQRILEEKFVTGIEKKYKTLNNEIIWVRESARYIETAGNKVLIEGSVENITDNKVAEASIIEAKEKAENSNKIKSEFLAQMSHEIRTPVNTILNFTSLIRDEVRNYNNKEIEDYFDSIQLGSDRLIRTIDSILNLSQLQLRTYELNKEELNVSEIITGVTVEFKPLAKQKGLDLNFSDTDKPLFIWADKYSVSQIFANLVDNAIKYTEKGEINLLIQQNGNSEVNVVVEDTGLGMSDEFMQKLFEPFTQEESGYTRRFEGNGLGLALVKNYCDINDAKISVDSKKGVGSKFTITFKERI